MNTQKNLPEGVVKIQGQAKGLTAAIFAGVHGNETTGVLALQKILPKLKITSGVLYVIFANLPAIQKNVRQINKNLNRCFVAGNNGNTYEDQRARELMLLLDKCDVLLDLHAYNDAAGEPFVVCEQNALEVAKVFDVAIISTNWDAYEPGATDGYMYNTGKIGVCLECGAVPQAQKYVAFTVRSIYQFLQYFGLLNAGVEYSDTAKTVIETKQVVMRTSKDFYLEKNLKTFDELTSGRVFGSQDGVSFVGRKGEYILFPHHDAMVGTEAFLVGKLVKG